MRPSGWLHYIAVLLIKTKGENIYNRIVLIKHEMNSLTLRHLSICFSLLHEQLSLSSSKYTEIEGRFFLKKETSKPSCSLSFWHPLICHIIVFSHLWAVDGSTVEPGWIGASCWIQIAKCYRLNHWSCWINRLRFFFPSVLSGELVLKNNFHFSP